MAKMKHYEPMTEEYGGMIHHEKMRHHEAQQHHSAIKHHAEGGYKHETDKPSQPAMGHGGNDYGCSDYKGDAMDIAYGQAGEQGCKSDGSKIVGQFKDYHWAD